MAIVLRFSAALVKAIEPGSGRYNCSDSRAASAGPSPRRMGYPLWFRKGIGIERKGDEMLKGKGILSEAQYGVNKEG